ncbi:hypothetical protein ES703_103942 [subsurface metagenome]
MSTIVADNLVEKLKVIQARDGLSNRKFAKEKLGVSPELWRLTLNGERRIGRAIQEGILRSYPELKEDVVAIFLPSDVESSSVTSDLSTTPHQTAQDKILGVLRAFRDKLYLWLRAIKAR